MRNSVFWRALGLDLLLIILFAAIGRRSHDESGALSGVLSVAAPFLIGYTAAAIATGLWRAPLAISSAIIAWVPGIALGLLLRGTIFDRGTARSFMVVAFVVTGVFLLGWRAIVALVRRGRSTA